jgi:hypothetical protein
MNQEAERNSDVIPGGAELLQAAYLTVERAGLPRELTVPAFEGVLALALHGRGASVGAVGVTAPAAGAAGADPADEAGRLGALAQRLGLSVHQVAEVFYEEGDELKLGVAASRFGSTKSDAARRISLLVVLGRQFDGAESWTPVSLLRQVCQEYNAFDVSNFAKHVLSLDDVLLFQGSGPSRKVRLTRPGLEVGAHMIQELSP